MKTRFLFLVLSLSLFELTHGQTWELVKSISLTDATTSQSIDNQGAIYIGTESGNVIKYDQSGEIIETYSEFGKFPVTIIEAWNRFKPFIFYERPQQFYFIDRFSTSPVMYELSDFYSGLATLCAPGLDNSLWVLSTNFSELKKFDIQTRRLISVNPLRINLNSVTYLRSHKNTLILCDPKSGLYYFDQFGNQLSHNPEIKISTFQVSQNNLLFLQNDSIKTIELQFRSFEEKIKAPEQGFINVLKFGNRYVFIRNNELRYYNLSL